MKKILNYLIIIFSLYIIIGINNVYADNEIMLTATVDGVTKEVKGLTKEVEGGHRNYVDMKDFCNKFYDFCLYSPGTGEIVRYINSPDNKRIMTLSVKYNKITNNTFYGKTNINKANYSLQINLLESSIINGKYFPIRFFSQALGCYITGSKSNFTIDSDNYRERIINKNLNLNYSFDNKNYSVKISNEKTLSVKFPVVINNNNSIPQNWNITSNSGKVHYTIINSIGKPNTKNAYSFVIVYGLDYNSFPSWTKVYVTP